MATIGNSYLNLIDLAKRTDAGRAMVPVIEALTATPTNSDAVYAKIELWVRKDNFIPLKWIMFDKKAQPVKTLLTKEIQRHGGHWFITSSRMNDNATGRSTELKLEKIDVRDDIPLDNFSVRAIEKG